MNADNFNYKHLSFSDCGSLILVDGEIAIQRGPKGRYWVDIDGECSNALAVMDDFGNLVEAHGVDFHRTGLACFYWGDQPNMPIWFKQTPDWKFL